MREIDAAGSAPAQSLGGISQFSNLLSSLLGRGPARSAPHGYSDDRTVTASANLGSVPYLRGEGDEWSAGKTASGMPTPKEDPKAALKSLSLFLTEHPEDDKTLAKRAQMFNSLKMYKEAEADARKALEHNPNNALAWAQLAWSLLKQGRYKDALACIERAILANPRSASNYAIRAFIRYMLGDLAGAMKDMEMAASMDPRYRAKLEAFKNGAKLYDPNGDSELTGMLLGSRARRLPIGVGLGLLAALGLAGWRARMVYARRRLFSP